MNAIALRSEVSVLRRIFVIVLILCVLGGALAANATIKRHRVATAAGAQSAVAFVHPSFAVCIAAPGLWAVKRQSCSILNLSHVSRSCREAKTETPINRMPPQRIRAVARRLMRVPTRPSLESCRGVLTLTYAPAGTVSPSLLILGPGQTSALRS